MNNMVKRLVAYPLCIMAMIVSEWTFSLGSAFNIENYSIFGWICQGLALIFAIGTAEIWVRHWK